MARADDVSDAEKSSVEWKQAMRDQVEEDLEYQVRLRLQIHPDLYARFKQRPAALQSLYTPRRPAAALRKCQLLELESPWGSHHDEKQVEEVIKTSFEDKGMFGSTSEQCEKEYSKSNPKEKCHNMKDLPSNKVHSQNSAHDVYGQNNAHDVHGQNNAHDVHGQNNAHDVHGNNVAMVCADDAINLPAIFDYINIKYGVPRTQLRNLSEKGCYNTFLNDSSGVGAGPNIKYPVEACVHFPTPNHLKTNCKPSTTIPSINSSELTTIHCKTKAKLVYTTEEEVKAVPKGSLRFESRFESGNLYQAHQLTSQEYILWLAPDLYSKKHTQWFYFRVEGMVMEQSYTFHIVNFYKADSLYNYGMKPLLYSEENAEKCGNGWSRVGHHVCYHKTAFEHVPLDTEEKLYTLTWTMEFPCTDDTCYLAYCFPYSYSQLLLHLSTLEESPVKSGYLATENLCFTLAGNACPLLTITKFDEHEKQPRMGIVITARVHPGETNSSWIMQGLLDYLTSESTYAKDLRSRYVFKLVPMLNPDGVIVGNYRTSLAAVDLNRVYKSPRADLFPTIYHVKNMLKEFMKERKLLLYIDLHGHSRKQNVFMYGCHTRQGDHMQLLQERVLPFLLSQQAPQMFDFGSCKFSVQRCKEATGRVVTWRMGVLNSYTMESSFYGSSDTKCHFTTEDLMCLGEKLTKAIHCYDHYSESESYRVQVHSKIAKVILTSKPDCRITRNCVLPQITGSSETILTGLKKSRHYSPKALKKFMKMDTRILEVESSTSGSDSENDNLSWNAKEKSKRKASQKNRKEISKFQPVKSMHQKLQGASYRLSNMDSYSAPARLSNMQAMDASGAKSTLPCTWKFVSKYKHRSNGGIPIYSEERLQERKQKRVQSEKHPSEHEAQLETPHLWTLHQGNKSRLIEPIRDCREAHHKHTVDACIEERTRLRESIMKLKLSPQLAKYISETWKSI